ncbi:MAG: acetyltransferase [Thermodesulfobacteriota bacterium]|nr:acetyltransferase [Thermodesulfobacteriota bacterium]
MAAQVIGLGAGGHASVIIDILHMDDRYKVVGLLDQSPGRRGDDVLGVPVLGADDCLSALADDGVTHFFVGIGSTDRVEPRRRLYEMALSLGMTPVSVIHPEATVATSASLGAGVTIMAGAVINARAFLGANVIINTGAIIEHDCNLGNHVHVATGARLAGTVRLETGVHIGAGATVRQDITVGENAIVGIGAAVVKDIASDTVVAGVPAEILKNGR